MRKVGHHVEPDLDPGIPQETVGLYSICHRAAPAIESKNLIVHVLDAQFYFRDPEVEHPVDMFFFTPVRPGLERNRNATDISRLVCRLNLCNGRHGCCRRVPGVYIHRLDAPGDKLTLVLNGTGGHRPAHHNQFHFLDPVTQCLELPEPGMDLRERIVVMLAGPFRRRLLSSVTLRRPEQMRGPPGRGDICRAGTGRARSSPQPARHPTGYGWA